MFQNAMLASIAGLAAGLLPAGAARAQSFNVLYSFQPTPNFGTSPGGSLAVGDDGSIYGSAQKRGASYAGTLFRVTGGGALTVLHTFVRSDGERPSGGLTLRGNTLFGAAAGGGPNGTGVIFSMKTDGSQFRILHDAYAVIAVDGHNTIYGANSTSLFRLMPDGTYTVLYTFGDGRNNGVYNLAIDRNGNLFGANYYITGAGYSCNVFRYDQMSTSYTTIYTVTEPSGIGCFVSVGGVDGRENVYGFSADSTGPRNHTGTLFQLSPSGTAYSYTLLHTFSHGQSVPTSLLVSRDGTLTGTSISYYNSVHFATHSGTLFQMAGGTFRILHLFNFDTKTQGSYPGNVPMRLPSGEIVGSTAMGGSSASYKTTCNPTFPYEGCGTIYTYTP